MPHRYFYAGPLEVGGTVNLNEEERRHIKQVMRTKEGATIEVINGRGDLAQAAFGDRIVVKSLEHESPSKEVKGLALALTEPRNLELVIEKATELGIDQFYIFPSAKSKLNNLSKNKEERIHKILISAIKQSKRLHLPTVHFLSSKEQLPQGTYLLADFDGACFNKVTSSATFIIGPESGFTPSEIEFFKTKLRASSVLLSKNTLRTETAAICAATLLFV